MDFWGKLVDSISKKSNTDSPYNIGKVLNLVNFYPFFVSKSKIGVDAKISQF